MHSEPPSIDLIRHLARIRGIPESEATQILDEVLQYFNETCEQFVRRRHRELQGSGLGNDEIYQRIRQQLPEYRFPASDLSERQIRRMIYG